MPGGSIWQKWGMLSIVERDCPRSTFSPCWSKSCLFPLLSNLQVTFLIPVLGHTCSSSCLRHSTVIPLLTVSSSFITPPNEPVFHDSLSPWGSLLLGPQFLHNYTSCPHTDFPVVTRHPRKEDLPVDDPPFQSCLSPGLVWTSSICYIPPYPKRETGLDPRR